VVRRRHHVARRDAEAVDENDRGLGVMGRPRGPQEMKKVAPDLDAVGDEIGFHSGEA
jgi:hypothetical protein